ncbi:MAG: winged helix-turn-helix domain-containing protein [Thermoanaerobaculia bacterium]
MPLQPQPARVLALLTARPGEVVSREEIRHLLWGDDIHVEFDQSINFCIHHLRQALRDSAERPFWIGTVPRFGYRFLPPVTVEEPEPRALPVIAPAALSPATGSATTPPGGPARLPAAESHDRSRRMPSHRLWAAGALCAAFVGCGLILRVEVRQGQDLRRTVRPADATSSPSRGGPAEAAYHRGLYLSRREGRDVVERGIRALRESIRLDAAASGPHAALAEALISLHRYEPSKALLDESAAAAGEAVALSPDSAAAHLAWASALVTARYDWASAEREYRAALRLEPELAKAHSGLALVLAASARFDEAIAESRRALELDPVCLSASADLGWYYFLARRYDEAIAASREALELDPADTSVHLNIIYAELEKGDEAAALQQANAHLAAYFSATGRPAPRVATLGDYWRGFVDHLSVAGGDASPAGLAVARLDLGEDAAAMAILLQGCRQHTGRDALFASVNPRFRRWRADPRLQQVVACVGLS